MVSDVPECSAQTSGGGHRSGPRCPLPSPGSLTYPPKANGGRSGRTAPSPVCFAHMKKGRENRSEEHTSELQSLMRISYAVFCLKKKNSMYCIHSLVSHI